MTGEGECMERLQKVIAASGITSRRKAEQYIVEGRVKVNGEVVDRLGAQVKKGDIIEVDGERIIRENKVYYLMNKPKRTLCASSDDRGRQTVIDLMDCEERVFSVGRLDYDTSGALIITNDGEFANQIVHPRYHLPKTYNLTINGILSPRDMKALKEGIVLDGTHDDTCTRAVAFACALCNTVKSEIIGFGAAAGEDDLARANARPERARDIASSPFQGTCGLATERVERIGVRAGDAGCIIGALCLDGLCAHGRRGGVIEVDGLGCDRRQCVSLPSPACRWCRARAARARSSRDLPL